MANDVAFSCECGAIHGVLTDVSEKTGTGIVCHCSQCRASEVFLDQPDPEDDGVAIFQTTVDHVKFTVGADKLYAFSFETGKLIHWYAKCCKVPMFNTMAKPEGGFVGVMVDRLAETAPLGRIKAMLYADNGKGGQSHTGLRHVIIGGTRRAIRMCLTGKWKNSPFFGKSGAPVSKVHVLSKVEKSQLPLEQNN